MRPLSVMFFLCATLSSASAFPAEKPAARGKLLPIPKDTLPQDLDLKHVPAGLSKRRIIPKDNPLTSAKVELGRKLFFDGRLSDDGSVACASCHRPDRGFASADVRAVGIGGKIGPRNAPSLLNRAYGKSMFWDGRAATLEEQSLKPIASKLELGSNIKDVLKRLNADAGYVKQFKTAFGESGDINAGNLAKALASFQRTLLLGDSPIDRFRGGDPSALTDDERQGLWLFESKARCWKCHSGNDFTDESFHNTGVSWGGEPADLGRFVATGKVPDVGKFKTPTLRGVALTGPYMHDGSIKTLKAVVEFYNKGGKKNPNADPLMRPLGLSTKEQSQLVAFLQALSRTSDRKSVLPPTTKRKPKKTR